MLALEDWGEFELCKSFCVVLFKASNEVKFDSSWNQELDLCQKKPVSFCVY